MVLINGSKDKAQIHPATDIHQKHTKRNSNGWNLMVIPFF